MKDIQFPIFKTKIDNSSERFDLTDFNQRQAYFEFKAGKEIEKLREYLKNNTFIAYLLGKKSSGKGTYAKMFKEIIDKDKIEHFSIGDMVRRFDAVVADENKKKELIYFLEKNYRGFMSLEEIIRSLEQRSTKTLLSSELILALVKDEISKIGKKAVFIDGFPRDLDQISYSLFFRDLIEYREDPDIFVLIDVPEAVIDERIKYRVICPVCQTSRNLKLLPTKNAGYDKERDKFFLVCDNSSCQKERMVTKEGDELGIEPIKNRLKTDENLIKRAFSLYGIPKILLRNSIPVDKAKEFTDDYEITPEYVYNWNDNDKKVEIIEKPWQILDDEGVASNSLMPPPVVVSLIKQITDVLNL
ncbi:MAG: nucleoside monophosphate kinase [Candidatus Pacebacteria bacterium]|nr:nucleoside monophosphate kinase [Candidatus Paceibacterota bacterium]